MNYCTPVSRSSVSLPPLCFSTITVSSEIRRRPSAIRPTHSLEPVSRSREPIHQATVLPPQPYTRAPPSSSTSGHHRSVKVRSPVRRGFRGVGLGLRGLEAEVRCADGVGGFGWPVPSVSSPERGLAGMSIPSAREGQLCYRRRIAAGSPTSHGATLAPAACTALSSYIPVLKKYEYIIFR